jgi:phage tail sheath protein FI
MPEYLAPGVFIEEVSYRAKSIEGVSTTTTGFVGPTRYGPTEGPLNVITSLTEFDRVYGDLAPLDFDGNTLTNYVGQAVRTFFEQGGKRIYIARVFEPKADDDDGRADKAVGPLRLVARHPGAAGNVRVAIGLDVSKDVLVRSGGETQARGIKLDDIVLLTRTGGSSLRRVTRTQAGKWQLADELTLPDADAAVDVSALNPGNGDKLQIVTARLDVRTTGPGYSVVGLALHPETTRPSLAADLGAKGAAPVTLAGDKPNVKVNWPNLWTALSVGLALQAGASTQLAVDAATDALARATERKKTTADAAEKADKAKDIATADRTAADKALADGVKAEADAKQASDDAPDDAGKKTAWEQAKAKLPGLRAAAAAAQRVEQLASADAEAAGERDDASDAAVDAAQAKLDEANAAHDAAIASQGDPAAAETAALDALAADDDEQPVRSFEVALTGGNDGKRPSAGHYNGDDAPELKHGLVGFEDIEDISIVAAPGVTDGWGDGDYGDDAATVVQALIGHCERMRYRIAVLDSGKGQDPAAVQAMRAGLDSKHAALYYPWITVLDPVTQVQIDLPPSGFIAGIYARNDIQRAVWKAPANEVITGALGFERFINKGQQEVLNPLGINCLRSFEGRGNRVWGARTISSDPEWKYVNLRRYFAYLERSIERGTQWAVFEPNGEQLWANVRRTISDFLLNEFANGALLGSKPESAFFVRCDRSTMTQNDLDNGRLVCLIGVAALRPAEFVIFRIGQWTGDRKS